jgi:hypothetical protein
MRSTVWLLILGLVLAVSAGPAGAADLSDREKASGRKLYVTKCAKCHKFYDPNKYSDQDWQTWMSKMSKKSKLSPEQEQLLVRYIDEAIRKPGKAKESASAPSK